ncbi:MAG TPA: hypothetical protein H9753_13775 [Candidatus Blautia merdavium]|uniref:Bypass of forespore C C-terminal domain-containing protein n=1 Tax=Candidatus Blautia merdavium TaxID=2838494 RepID=A0A9D2PQN9_9FIRM|nr:hypothetical protein [Candidatus Blautia merdavium]
MKKIIYGIGCFLAVLFLGTGMFLSYQINVLRDRMEELEENTALARQEVSALADSKNQDFIFERYEGEELVREHYRMTAYGADRIVLRQEPEESLEEGYLVKVRDGVLVVYENKTGTVFESTDIPLEALPSELKAEVLLGKNLKNLDELYNFLENYSS